MQDGPETRGRYLSAYDIVQSFRELMADATRATGNLQPFLQQLSRYDARDIKWIESQQELSKSIAIRVLRAGMFRSRDEDEIESLITPFLDPSHTKVHGRPIYPDLARACGLQVKMYGLRSSIWALVWDLYLRFRHCVTFSSPPSAKILESARTSYTAPGQG